MARPKTPNILARKQPKQERSTQLVDAILEAAIRVLRVEGAQRFTMARVAEKAGFTREGMTRGSSWVNGRFSDDVIFGLLAGEFTG